MSKTELNATILRHLKRGAERTPGDQEIAECADRLVSFFELLLEADKKLMETHDLSNNRNPDNTN